MAMPTYMGLRVNLYGPAMTRLVEARSGRMVVPERVKFTIAEAISPRPTTKRIAPAIHAAPALACRQKERAGFRPLFPIFCLG